MSMPSAACVIFQGLGKLLALNICCFVVNLLLVAFCAIFSAVFGVKLDFIGIIKVSFSVQFMFFCHKFDLGVTYALLGQVWVKFFLNPVCVNIFTFCLSDVRLLSVCLLVPS